MMHMLCLTLFILKMWHNYFLTTIIHYLILMPFIGAVQIFSDLSPFFKIIPQLINHTNPGTTLGKNLTQLRIY